MDKVITWYLVALLHVCELGLIALTLVMFIAGPWPIKLFAALICVPICTLIACTILPDMWRDLRSG